MFPNSLTVCWGEGGGGRDKRHKSWIGPVIIYSILHLSQEPS